MQGDPNAVTNQGNKELSQVAFVMHIQVKNIFIKHDFTVRLLT